MWEGNKSQAGSLESIILDEAKRILGYSSKTSIAFQAKDISLQEALLSAPLFFMCQRIVDTLKIIYTATEEHTIIRCRVVFQIFLAIATFFSPVKILVRSTMYAVI